MAYNKDIQFIDISFSIVNQINNIQFNKECKLKLITNIREFWDCIMELNRKSYTVLDFGGMKRGQIQYNIKGGEDLYKKQCIIAKKKSSKDKDRIKNRDIMGVKKYYILVIRLTSIDSKYKRVRVRLI